GRQRRAGLAAEQALEQADRRAVALGQQRFEQLPLQVAEGLVQRQQLALPRRRAAQVAGKLGERFAQPLGQHAAFQARDLGRQRRQLLVYPAGAHELAFRQHVLQARQQRAQAGDRFLAAQRLTQVAQAEFNGRRRVADGQAAAHQGAAQQVDLGQQRLFAQALLFGNGRAGLFGIDAHHGYYSRSRGNWSAEPWGRRMSTATGR